MPQYFSFESCIASSAALGEIFLLRVCIGDDTFHAQFESRDILSFFLEDVDDADPGTIAQACQQEFHRAGAMILSAVHFLGIGSYRMPRFSSSLELFSFYPAYRNVLRITHAMFLRSF